MFRQANNVLMGLEVGFFLLGYEFMLACNIQVLQLTKSIVCAIKRLIKEGGEEVDEVLPIAGELKQQGGGHMDAKFERLKTSPSHSDSEKEGVRIEMNGGFRTLESGGKRNQKAIVEFICDKTRTGLENLYDPKEKYDEEKIKREEDDTKDEDDPKSSSLTFVRYEEEKGDADTLRMLWRTKYACEDSKDEHDAAKGNHWGFFTWFILMCDTQFPLEVSPKY
jgi:hypothetical protein